MTPPTTSPDPLVDRVCAKYRRVDVWLDRVAEGGRVAPTKQEIAEADEAREVAARLFSDSELLRLADEMANEAYEVIDYGHRIGGCGDIEQAALRALAEKQRAYHERRARLRGERDDWMEKARLWNEQNIQYVTDHELNETIARADRAEAERDALRGAIQSFHDKYHGRGGGPFSRPTPIALSECRDPRCRALLSSSPASEPPTVADVIEVEAAMRRQYDRASSARRLDSSASSTTEGGER